MAQSTTSAQKFRLRSADIAAWFRHRCDRNFRWNTVASELRERAGIGWNVPKRHRKHTRPGVALLMNTGNDFEADSVEALIHEHGETQVLCAGFEQHPASRTVKPFPFEQFTQALQQTPLPKFIAQLEMKLDDEAAARFLGQFGLDPQQVTLNAAKPDLIEVLHATEVGQPHKLRIWDYKASSAARHEHYIQVAYYSFLLDFALREAGVTNVVVDLDYAVIRSREPEPDEFELAPYRLAVSEYLREYVPSLFATQASDAHFHVEPGCMMCEYADHCRAEADAGFDLSRIAYLTSEARKQLRRLGLKTHRELAQLNDPPLLQQARTACYDLGLNLDRYIATAQALEDGQPRPLGAMTLMMPRHENIRIVISAEHDPVTNTCFALGLKTYEGWDETNNRVLGEEKVFIATEKGKEAEILLAFLRTLNDKLERIDAINRPTLTTLADAQTRAQVVSNDPQVMAAQQQLDAANAAVEQFKQRVPRLMKTNPDYETLHQEREGLKEAAKIAEQALKQAQKEATWRLRQQLQTLHFYLYDNIDLLYLQGLIERNLFRDEPAGLLAEMTRLVRLFPTESIIPDAHTFRSMPGTIVTQVLRALVALPTPYQFDLKSVSQTYQPHKTTGEENGFLFRPKYGFAWDSSNQVAFERIHDVWNGDHYAVENQFDLTPAEVLAQIEKTLLTKLRATDSVVRRIKQEFRDALRLRKEPFQLYGDFNPLDFQTLEALRVFAIMENSLDELSIKHTHTLPLDDRNNKFVCIRGVQYTGSAEADGSMWFTFDPTSRDAKFEVGDFNLVLTNEDQPDTLMGKIDGRLFDGSFWGQRDHKVTIQEFDFQAIPPRIRLLPDNPTKFPLAVDLTRPCVLDQIYSDYNTPKILDVLSRLHNDPMQAQHVHDLLRDGVVDGWQPLVTNTQPLEQQLRQLATQAGKDEHKLLNAGQWRALHGVFQEPLTLVWGPPGTGKTHTLAHILLAYALAAQQREQKLRLLVTAFTHHAIANVMKKVAELANEYGLDDNAILLRQVEGSGSSAYDDLPERVVLADKKQLGTLLDVENRCVVVGSTVWGLYSGMKEAGGAVRQWFDVILVDEASQMKLPDALIALSASKLNANIILAGDDQQLPPIIHGAYPEEHEHLLTSVFAFVRHQVEEQQTVTPQIEERRLFQLEDNFRMNEPLTAYPRDVLYRGRFQSIRPDIRMVTQPLITENSPDVLDQIMLPDRPVVLCWYTAPQSFTARNPIEAELVAELTDRLSQILWDEREDQNCLFTPAHFAQRGIAVLSPHRAQNSAIRQALREKGYDTDQRPLPLVDTVDKLQGKEREVILVSYGVADSEFAMAEAAFLLSQNRFNVAVTRAQKKAVVVCSEQVLNVVPTDRQVLLDSMMLKEFRRYCTDGHIVLPWQSATAGAIQIHIQWKSF